MKQKELVKELKFGPHRICLFFQDQIPIAIHDEQTFTFLWELIEKIPPLSDALYLSEFAFLSNFFWKAGQFQYIECIESYQKYYLERVELERSQPVDLFEYRLTDYKIFDVSVMHPPKVENRQLIYFTCNVTNGLPYRVVCPFPYHLESTHVHYQILPIK
ncbi:MAG: hypothetical protein ACHQUC_03020 [Chlamydiales bacterium]